MKHALLALLLALVAHGACAQERMLVFTSPITMRETTLPLFEAGWTTKALIGSTGGYYVIVLVPPQELPADHPTRQRLPVPGGLEERRAKLLATKPEAQKP